MGLLLVLTIPLHLLWTKDSREYRVKPNRIISEIRDMGYYWHISLYLAMFLFKAFTDNHNEPLKEMVGGFTHLVYSIEGELVLFVQDRFRNESLSEILSLHYLFAYLFIIWYPPIHHILSGDKDLADLSAMNYLVIYLLAVPFYLFFNVEVTSSYLPGVDALMYHDSWNLRFFTNNDPLDNGVPSLHVGLPASLLLIHRAYLKEKNIQMSDWRHRGLDRFIIANVAIYMFSILYLGIHWLSDVVPGLLLAIICSRFCIRVQPVLRKEGVRGFLNMLTEKTNITPIITCAVVGSLAIMAAIGGPGTSPQNPDFRMEGDDVKLEPLEIHSLDDPVYVDVMNVGDIDVKVLFVNVVAVEPMAERGRINFDSVLPEGELKILEPGSTWTFDYMPKSSEDNYVILLKSGGEGGEIAEVSILSEYPGADLALVSGFMISMLSFIVVGISANPRYKTEA